MPCCSMRSQLSRGVMQGLVLVCRPFLEESGCRIFPPEVSSKSLFEGASKEHGGPGVLLLPAVEIAMAVFARAAQVLTDLGVAKGGHEATFGSARPPAPSSVH